MKPVIPVPEGSSIPERAAKYLNSLPKIYPKNKVIPQVPKNLNFGISDLLSIENNGATFDAAIDAIKRFGTHSGGSPLFYGINLVSKKMVATFEEWINSNLYEGRLKADRAVLRNYKDAYS